MSKKSNFFFVEGRFFGRALPLAIRTACRPISLTLDTAALASLCLRQYARPVAQYVAYRELPTDRENTIL